ncbi:MAG: DMT family transporter [Pseudomonadota bacterium]
MEIWIPITLSAAFFQNIRFLLQKQLTGTLSTLGVTFARFLFAAPLALVLAFALTRGAGWPEMPPVFWAFAVSGGIAQILATALVVHLFSLRNFAVGLTFSKTETVTTALLSALLLGEWLTPAAQGAILITVAGVAVMSAPPGVQWIQGMLSRAAGLGILAGAIFSMSSVGYRGAALSLSHGSFYTRAAVVLAMVTLLQSVLMALWLVWREPGQVQRVVSGWRRTALVGLFSALGSFGWFSAFALVNAAWVKALGQVEIVFNTLTSILVFGERLTAREALGITLVLVGALTLILTS